MGLLRFDITVNKAVNRTPHVEFALLLAWLLIVDRNIEQGVFVPIQADSDLVPEDEGGDVSGDEA